jgi:hypothetical protein
MKKLSLALVAAGTLALGGAQSVGADQPRFDVICKDKDGNVVNQGFNLPASQIQAVMRYCGNAPVRLITRVS